MHTYLFRTLFNLKRVQKIALCFVLGGLSSLALAPYYLVFCLFAFPVFLVLLQSAPTMRQSFTFGWFFGFGFFVAGLYWISFALHVDLEKFWWLIPFAVLGIPFILSFAVACASLLTWRFAPPEYPYFPLFFAACFSFFEYLRGTLFTGFPWNLIGHTWGFYPEMMQITSVIGVYGLSLLTVVAFCLASNSRGFFIGLFIFSSLWMFGNSRIPHEKTELNEKYNLVLVQPNISQLAKWNLDLADEQLDHLIDLSNQGIAKDKINILIWPETAITYFLQNQPERIQRIKKKLPSDSVLIAGGIDIEFKDKTPLIYNSVFIGSPRDYKAWFRYDKFHLVPFGEYIPFRKYFPYIPVGGTDFSPGAGNITYTPPGTEIAISPLVCYEGIFPGGVVYRDPNGMRPSLLVNLTNDAWYLDSIGPYQHHDNVRFRAVEEGTPLVRVANTGISSLIDAYGRIIVSANLMETKVIRSNLPPYLQNATIFAQYGNKIYLLLVAFLLATPIFHYSLRFLRGF